MIEYSRGGSMHKWDNEQYLKFKKERTQPSIDLINKLDNHNYILDIGCGPGNSTKALLNKYPNADILGVDYDNNMINKAIYANLTASKITIYTKSHLTICVT